MKSLNDELQQQQQQNLIKEEHEQDVKFDTGFKQADNIFEEKTEETSKEISEQPLTEGIQEVQKEDGIREMKGDQPAGPKYIGMDKKFTKIQSDDSERMVAVRSALSMYQNDMNIATVTKLIEACNDYCKGRFAFFKAFRKAGVRLAEVKALRAEAQRIRDGYLKSNVKLIYEETNVKEIKNVRSVSLKTKINSQTLKEEEAYMKHVSKFVSKNGDLEDDGAYDEDLEYDLVEVLAQTKQSLLDEYSKAEPDFEVIAKLEDEIKKSTERAYSFKDYLAKTYQGSKFMDDQWELDASLNKYRIAYQASINEKKIKEEAGTDEFKEELHQLAMNNYLINHHQPDINADQRDLPYDEKELKKVLKEFESFDLSKQFIFTDPVSILQYYQQNSAAYEHVRHVQYQLMEGFIHGFKMDDETIIKLRAKFNAAYEMHEYSEWLNKHAFEKKLDLTKSDKDIEEHIRKLMQGNVKEFFHVMPTLGNVDETIEKCEEKLRAEYESREENITKILRVQDYGDEEDPSIPMSKIEKKMKAYESNSLIYEYMHQKLSHYHSNVTENRIKAHNEANGDDCPTTSGFMDRLHGNFMFGKSNEEIVRLTKLAHGSPAEKVQYCIEAIKELKKYDLKEFELDDISKFYEDYERKEYIMQLYTNSESLASGIIEQLRIMQEDEDEPLVLPQELQEMGYKTIEDLYKEMYVYNQLGNALQGKITSLGQARDFGFMGAFSLKELVDLDSKSKRKQEKNVDAHKNRMGYPDYDNGTVEAFIEDITYRTNQFFNMDIDTKPLTKEEKEAGKYYESVVFGNKVMDLYRGELEAYDRKLKEGKIKI